MTRQPFAKLTRQDVRAGLRRAAYREITEMNCARYPELRYNRKERRRLARAFAAAEFRHLAAGDAA